MARIVTALLVGCAAGAIVMAFVLERHGRSADDVVRDIVDVPALSAESAAQHRQSGYRDITSIEQVVALPGEFARAEALHVLAGRSDAAAVQALIFAANRIGDEEARRQLLGILFYRLAELDPASALALSRTDYFRAIRDLERTVWHARARKDLDEALFAAKTQTSRADQAMAAQSLYAAFGYLGNARTDRIEAELGIGPDRATRARYLYRLADRAPAEAIRFINEYPPGPDRGQMIGWLAYYLSQYDPAAASRYADVFEDPQHREYYESVIASNAASEAPRQAIDRILANGSMERNRTEFWSAMRTLAADDLDAAIQYFESARNAEEKRAIGRIIAEQMTARDPQAAIAWAADNESDDHSYLLLTVLWKVAKTDPAMAMSVVEDIPDATRRRRTMANLVAQIGTDQPATAARYIDSIEQPGLRAEAKRSLAQSWLRRDPDAALEWILSHDTEESQALLERSSWALLETDIDAAIAILPQMSMAQQRGWRGQIAQKLAMARSPAEAQAFIRRFEGAEGYAQLQASVITGVARADALLARQMAAQLADPAARDAAYVGIVNAEARVDPQAAVALLDSIIDERQRAAATSQLVMQWHEADPSGAMRWASSLPTGASRDDAIQQLAQRWREPTEAQWRLIESIGDRRKRGEAKFHHAMRVARTDPGRARELLDDPDIPSHQREQAETALQRLPGRY